MASELERANSQHDVMTSTNDVGDTLRVISQLARQRTVILETVSNAADWSRCESHLDQAIASQSPVCLLISHDSWTTIPQRWVASPDIHVVDSTFAGNLFDAIRESSEHLVSLVVMESESSERKRDNSLKSRLTRVDSAIARADRSAIWTKTFRTDPRRWISLYNQVGERDLYLWQWCLHGIEITTLPIVQDELFNEIVDLKLLSVIICVLFDDVADQSHNEQWLRELVNVVHTRTISSQLDEHICDHVQIAHELWQAYETRVRALPEFAELESVWQFDIDQFLTSMRYAQMINQSPDLANPTEHDVYTPHNMLMVSFGTLDMMASNTVPASERGAIREALWHAQAMGRVGNVLSTWRREIHEGDYSNGLVARALSQELVTANQLHELSPEEAIELLKELGIEHELHAKWERHRRISSRAAARIHTFDMTSVLDSHDRFLEMHLGSTGLI